MDRTIHMYIQIANGNTTVHVRSKKIQLRLTLINLTWTEVVYSSYHSSSCCSPMASSRNDMLTYESPAETYILDNT
jgi:hypothetical protein